MGDVLITIGIILLLLFPTVGYGLIYRFTTANEKKEQLSEKESQIDHIRQPRFLVEELSDYSKQMCKELNIDGQKILQEWRLENKSFSYTVEEKNQLMQLPKKQRRRKIYIDYIRQPKFLHEPFEKRFLPYTKAYKINALNELIKWREENGIVVTDTSKLIINTKNVTKHQNQKHTPNMNFVPSSNPEEITSREINSKNESNKTLNNNSDDELRRF